MFRNGLVGWRICVDVVLGVWEYGLCIICGIRVGIEVLLGL